MSTSPPQSATALVLNPHALTGAVARTWRATRETVRTHLAAAGTLETRGDGGDIERIARLLDATRPATVVAAGGDGTLHDVVEALMRHEPAARPSLGILPLGTANNAARSLGLPAVRIGGAAAVDAAVAAVAYGPTRAIDVGQVDERHFIGALAVGVDADILALRNHLRRRYRLGPRVGGYPLYLWSCAVNVLARAHGAPARLTIDGACREVHPYNLLITNTAIYAGEFRFDGGDHADDGALDLLLFPSAADYLTRFPRAWRRHVAATRAHPVAADPDLERVRTVTIELRHPVAVQVDGEEYGVHAHLAVRVVPGALTVHAPTATGAWRPRAHAKHPHARVHA